MANTLTGLYRNGFAALEVVSREPIGMIHAVSKDVKAEQVTLNQPIRAAVVPELPLEDITPSNISPTGSKSKHCTVYRCSTLPNRKKFLGI